MRPPRSLPTALLGALLIGSCNTEPEPTETQVGPEPAAAAPEPVLRRLTTEQYVRTVQNALSDALVMPAQLEPDSERDGGHTLRRVIDPGSDKAAIQTPHDLTMAIAESEPGAVSAEQTTGGNELLIGLSGQISVTSGDQTTTLEAYDTLPLPAGVTRQYRNSGDGPAALLIVGEAAAASA